jgi:hypothetical protein
MGTHCDRAESKLGESQEARWQNSLVDLTKTSTPLERLEYSNCSGYFLLLD